MEAIETFMRKELEKFMNKDRMMQLALMGLTSGLVVGCGGGDKKPSDAKDLQDAVNDKKQQVSGGEQGAEATLLAELDDKHRAIYHSLDAKHKEMALEMAQQACAGQNECKGLNQCKGASNACAGQGQCAGMGGCAWSDKNMMVRVVMKHMAEQRGQMNY